MKGFGVIAKPLTTMLKKEGFHWSSQYLAAFEELKKALTSTPVLAIPDFTKLFVVECDASDACIGAVLSQEGHPIDFMSKVLSQRHLALFVYEKEMLAIVSTVQQWRPYLLGHHFRIITNHRTPGYFLNQRVTTHAQQKWLLKLLGYDYSIQYKVGKSNVVPDSLSRRPVLAALMGMSKPVHSYVQKYNRLASIMLKQGSLLIHCCLERNRKITSRMELTCTLRIGFLFHQLVIEERRYWKNFMEGLLEGIREDQELIEGSTEVFAWHGM